MLNKYELLFVVDEHNQPLEPKTRDSVHKDGDWHRVSHVWIFNHNFDVLCQKRSEKKDKNPGKWEPYFGGHLGPGTDYLEGALTEVSEELSLTLAELTFAFVHKNISAKEFQGIFYAIWSGQFDNLQLETDEVAEISWIPIEKLLTELEKNDPDWVDFGYTLDIRKYISAIVMQENFSLGNS